jgi:hypothetical protein
MMKLLFLSALFSTALFAAHWDATDHAFEWYIAESIRGNHPWPPLEVKIGVAPGFFAHRGVGPGKDSAPSPTSTPADPIVVHAAVRETLDHMKQQPELQE